MSVDRSTADATTLPAGTTRRARPVAMALVALGAPFALAAPAVASDDGPPHGHKETPANGQHAEPAPAPDASAEIQGDATVGTQAGGGQGRANGQAPQPGSAVTHAGGGTEAGGSASSPTVTPKSKHARGEGAARGGLTA